MARGKSTPAWKRRQQYRRAEEIKRDAATMASAAHLADMTAEEMDRQTAEEILPYGTPAGRALLAAAEATRRGRKWGDYLLADCREGGVLCNSQEEIDTVVGRVILAQMRPKRHSLC